MQNKVAVAQLEMVGLSRDISETFTTARQFVLLLFGIKGRHCTSLDELRYQVACTTDKAGSMFPPTDDAFKQHFLRVNYQVAVWVHSHLAKPLLWTPEGNGWHIDSSGYLTEVYFEKDAAPVELRDMTHLYCADGDCVLSRKCHCVASGLPCTQFCMCAADDCGNCATEILYGESDDEDIDDSD